MCKEDRGHLMSYNDPGQEGCIDCSTILSEGGAFRLIDRHGHLLRGHCESEIHYKLFQARISASFWLLPYPCYRAGALNVHDFCPHVLGMFHEVVKSL